MLQKTVEGVRAFNRFYTGVIGLLDRHILDSAYSLPEARVLYELYHREGLLAGEIAGELGIDKGYLSRMLDRFVRSKLVVRRPSIEDGRSMNIMLTAKGRAAFETLNKASDEQVRAMLEPLPEGAGERLLYHMEEIRKILKHL